jgi:hypothetical protein
LNVTLTLSFLLSVDTHLNEIGTNYKTKLELLAGHAKLSDKAKSFIKKLAEQFTSKNACKQFDVIPLA